MSKGFAQNFPEKLQPKTFVQSDSTLYRLSLPGEEKKLLGGNHHNSNKEQHFVSLVQISSDTSLHCGTIIDTLSWQMTDLRDGNMYKIVRIGNQVWMTENLRYAPDISNYYYRQNMSAGIFTYDDDKYNALKYGMLYTYQTALTACPEGWRLPAWLDVNNLLYTVEGKEFLEYYSFLGPDGKSGFNATLGGMISFHSGKFMNKDISGYYWLQTKNKKDKPVAVAISSYSEIISYVLGTKAAFSIRCIKCDPATTSDE